MTDTKVQNTLLNSNDTLVVSEGMDHEAIKKALAEKGLTLTAAAKSMSRSYRTLLRITKREAKSIYVSNALAALIDKPVEDVFPELKGSSKKLKTSEIDVIHARNKLIDMNIYAA